MSIGNKTNYKGIYEITPNQEKFIIISKPRSDYKLVPGYPKQWRDLNAHERKRAIRVRSFLKRRKILKDIFNANISIGRIPFALTLTNNRPVITNKEQSILFRKFLRKVRKQYPDMLKKYVWTKGVQRSGRYHMHFVVYLSGKDMKFLYTYRRIIQNNWNGFIRFTRIKNIYAYAQYLINGLWIDNPQAPIERSIRNIGYTRNLLKPQRGYFDANKWLIPHNKIIRIWRNPYNFCITVITAIPGTARSLEKRE